VTFYLLRDWNDIIKMVQGVIPDHLKGLVNKLVSECDEVLSAFIRGQLLVMLGLGIIYAVGLQLVGLDMAILIGMIAGLFSVVPYLGFAVGLLVGIIAGLVQYSGDLWALLPIILVFCVGSLIESMVLTPWLVGDRIGLHPVAVIFAVLAGGQMFGFVGVFLALPVASVLMVWVRYVYNEYTSSNWYATGQEGPSLDDS
jgi:predicted PurR-regulated permease PerM